MMDSETEISSWIEQLLHRLRLVGFQFPVEPQRKMILDEVAMYAAFRERQLSETRPILAQLNRGTAKAIVADILDQAQAKNRAKDVAEYLIGAKLQMLYGESVIRPKNVNTPSDHGDFQVGNAAIEVTVNSADKRHIQQISRLLSDSTLRVWLIVRLRDREKWQNAVDTAFEFPENDRVVVTDVETFLCQNVSERGNFEATGERETLNKIFQIYNDCWLPAAGGAGLRIVSGDPILEDDSP